MLNRNIDIDIDITLSTMNFVSRMLAYETKIDKVIQVALDSISDFGKCKNIKILQLDTTHDFAKLLGIMENGRIKRKFKKSMIKIKNTPLENIIKKKQPRIIFQNNSAYNIYLPLVGSYNIVLGLLILSYNNKYKLNRSDRQILIGLSTLIAISFENTTSFRLAMYDGLTGLFVRRQFDIRLKEEIERLKRYGGYLSLMMFDIDHFKKINDTFGHQQGDIVLQELSTILKETIRTNVDIACRYGGEEFIVIMPNSNIDDAYTLASRLRESCEEHKFSGINKSGLITISVGVESMSSKNIYKTRYFIRQVDEALYKAKRNGRNLVCRATNNNYK